MNKLNVLMAVAASTAMGGHNPLLGYLGSKDEIDIEREYALIQKKESKLSANKRAWVVSQYERTAR